MSTMVYKHYNHNKAALSCFIIFMIFINNRIIVDANLASKEHTFIKLDNKNLEQIAKVHKSHKWDRLRALEQNNLIDLLPDKAKEMISMYNDWAKKIGVIPWSEIQKIRGEN